MERKQYKISIIQYINTYKKVNLMKNHSTILLSFALNLIPLQHAQH